MSEKDFYQILGVSKNATQEEIKKAYQSLVKRYNPEKFRHETNCQENNCGLERAGTREKQFCSSHCQNAYEEYKRKSEKIKAAYKEYREFKLSSESGWNERLKYGGILVLVLAVLGIVWVIIRRLGLN